MPRGGTRKGAGRPPGNPADKRKPRSISLSDNEVKALRELAEGEESTSAVVQRLLREALQR